MGANCFYRNEIDTVIIPDKLKFIGYSAFNVNQISVVNNNPSNGIFYSKNPDGSWNDTIIVSYGGTKDSLDILSSNVTTIGKEAFMSGGLRYIQLPMNLKTIESHAFAFNNLDTIIFPSYLEFIGVNSFQNNNFSEFMLPTPLRENDTFLYWINSDSTIFNAGEIIIDFGDYYKA